MSYCYKFSSKKSQIISFDSREHPEENIRQDWILSISKENRKTLYDRVSHISEVPVQVNLPPGQDKKLILIFYFFLR